MKALSQRGIPRTQRLDPLARFDAKWDEDDNGCWIWSGSLNHKGYGSFMGEGGRGGRVVLAHRWSHETFIGPIPEGFQVDHLCRVRACVNPAHLESVTPRTNTLRSDSVSAINARKTHCKKGHEFTEDNLFPSTRVERVCLTCYLARDRSRKPKAAAA